MPCERSTDVRRVELSVFKVRCQARSLYSEPNKMFSSDTIFLASFLEVSRYFRTDCHLLIHSGIINLLVALIPFPRLENALILLMISSQIFKRSSSRAFLKDAILDPKALEKVRVLFIFS